MSSPDLLAPAGLSAADADLAERDPALPMLPVLLSDDVLSDWLSVRWGEPVVARRRYLRYKPATACLARVEVRPAAGGGPARTTMLAHWADPEGAKLAKARDKAPAGTVLLSDVPCGVLVTTPAADRHLPALRWLEDPARRDALLRAALGTDRFGGPDVVTTTLSYKPQRRWVGRVTAPGGEHALVRAYRPQDLGRVAEVWSHTRALADAGLPVARLLGTHHRAGLAGVGWVEGHQLRLTGDPATPEPLPQLLPLLGATLARLHARPTGLPAVSATERARAVRSTAAAGAVLLPRLASRLDRVVARTVASLRALPPPPRAALHGDLSADQVVVGAEGTVHLIDLDRSRAGAPADDLASLAATSPEPVVDAVMEAVLAGYAEHAAPPAATELATYTAAQLLARATDGFRSAQPDWSESLERAVSLAEELL